LNGLSDWTIVPVMTFPDTKINSTDQFADAYFERIGKAAASVDRNRLNDAALLLTEAYRYR